MTVIAEADASGMVTRGNDTEKQRSSAKWWSFFCYRMMSECYFFVLSVTAVTGVASLLLTLTFMLPAFCCERTMMTARPLYVVTRDDVVGSTSLKLADVNQHRLHGHRL